MKKWMCIVCGWIYDEAKGWPEDGIAPGTAWEDIPDDWTCPDCGVGKEDFEMLEISTDATAVVLPQHTLSAPVIIIGSGYAGVQQAKALRDLNTDIPIILICADQGNYYSKPMLSMALTAKEDALSLISEDAEHIASRLNITIHTQTLLTKIDSQAQTIDITNPSGLLETLPYSKLVLALGASPRSLPIAGFEHCLTINNLDDYAQFHQALSHAKRVAIIGDGLIACELANDLSNTGYDVHVIGIAKHPMTPLLPPAVGQRLQNQLPVQWALESHVSEVTQNTQGYHIHYTDAQQQKQILDADLVLSATGLIANTTLAEHAGLECNRGIVVDQQMQSNQNHIYAIGDCAEANQQYLPFIAPIQHQVNTAASHILGGQPRLNYPNMPVKVKTPAMPLIFMIPKEPYGDWNIQTVDKGIKALRYDRKGKVNGFVLTDSFTDELSLYR